MAGRDHSSHDATSAVAAREFGRVLLQHRRRLHLSQEQLAVRAGLSDHTISNLERGVGRVRGSNARKLVKALELVGEHRIQFLDLSDQVWKQPEVPPADVTGGDGSGSSPPTDGKLKKLPASPANAVMDAVETDTPVGEDGDVGVSGAADEVSVCSKPGGLPSSGAPRPGSSGSTTLNESPGDRDVPVAPEREEATQDGERRPWASSRWSTAAVLTVVLLAVIIVGVGTAVLSNPPLRDGVTEPVALSGLVVLENAETGKCADVPGVGKGRPDGHVSQSICEDTELDNQRWYLIRQPGNHQGYPRYLVRNDLDGLCLDVAGFGSVPPTTPVGEYLCDAEGDNQIYYTKRTARGWMFVNEKSDGLCLDVAGLSSNRDGQPLTMWPCDPHGDHDWIIRRPKQKMLASFIGAGCGRSGQASVVWGERLDHPEVQVKSPAGEQAASIEWTFDSNTLETGASSPSRWVTIRSDTAVATHRGVTSTYKWTIIPKRGAGTVACVRVKGYIGE